MNHQKYPKRMWVNQPSTLQQYHYLNGECVIALWEYATTWRIYFTHGDIESQQIDEFALSEGWPNELKNKRHP